MIEEIIETLGFKEEEAKAYLSLLELGSCPASELAKAMSTPRPTVYGYLDRLVAGGLVNKSLRHGVKMFVPEPGEKIRFLYKRKIDDLRTKEKALDKIVPELSKLAGSSNVRPRIQFFEGRDGFESALQDFLNYPGTTMRAFWSFTALMDATSEDFFRYLNKQRVLSNIFARGIWPHNHGIDARRFPFMGTNAELMREVRVAPAGSDTQMGYRIYANKVLFSSSRAESYCFIVESPELAHLMTVQHDALWSISKPMQTNPKDSQKFIKELKDDSYF